MKFSKRTNAIILWIISIGLLVSMVIAFTPSLGNLLGGAAATQGEPQLVVNGQAIREEAVFRARQNPPYNIGLEGEAGSDLQLLLTENLVTQALVNQAASNVRVSSAEVNDAVRDFRTAQNVSGPANDQRYLGLIAQYGFTDQGFRDYYREQLRLEKYQEGLIGNAAVTDAEVEAYYAANQDAYRSEPRIRARQIVVDDEALAQELHARATSGEDFAALAQEHSQERADRAGALGAAAGSTEPQPVGRAALPSPVAAAAFDLGGAGLSQVVETNGRFYLLAVEDYLPAAVRPLEEVRAQVEADALEVKQGAVFEETVRNLRDSAAVELPANSTLNLDDPAVARVGDEEIRRSELARALYLNPQIQQSLGPSTAELITGLFKPTILEQLIDLELAHQGAQHLGQTFIGSRNQVAQQALAFVSRDAVATEEDMLAYYEGNQDLFTVAASAVATQVTFADQAQASAFRSALLAGEALEDAAEAGGAVQDLGTVRPGALRSELDAALFQTDAFDPLPDGARSVSDVLVVTSDVMNDEAVSDEADSQETAIEETTTDEGAEADETTAEAVDATTDDADAGDTTADDADAVETDAVETDAVETDAVETDASDPDAQATRESFVVLVAERTLERVRSFEEVRGQLEQTVLQTNRSALQDAWLSGLRQEIPVENLLASATPLEPFTVDEPFIVDEPASDETATDGVATDGVATDEPTTDDPATDAAPAEETPADEPVETDEATDEATPDTD